jgi:hypothetical protein
MLKKLAALAAAAVIGGTVAGGASAAAPEGAYPTVIHTIETNKHQHVIDNGSPGFGIGDVYTISEGLSTPDGATRLGHMQEICTVIHAKDLALQCSATAGFQDGQMSVAGRFPPVDPDNSYAITGGTGAYENVGGHLSISPAPHRVLFLNFFIVP